MLSINRVMITGRLTRDPETKYLPSGTAICNISVAVNRRWLDQKTNEWKDDTAFIDVEAWDKVAERAAENLRKGRPVYIEGSLKMDSWERDGVKQTKLRVKAEVIKAFDVPQKGEAGGGDDGAEGGYTPSAPRQSSSAGGGGGYNRPPSAGGGGGARPAPSNRPSDDLDFQDQRVHDDIPF